MANPNKGTGFAPQAQSAPRGRNHLLVIAIDEYVHCPTLNNCVKDARDFIDVLTNRYQFEPDHILTLFNEEATLANIHTQFKKLKGRVGSDDNLLIYFSGHGETEDNVGYWVPVNAHPQREWEYFSTDNIKRRLDAINSFHTFVIVDACFSGALFSSYKSITPGYETKRSRWGLAASHSRERALDGTPGENSPFAATLLNQLKGSQDNLPVQELAAAVIRRVERATEGQQTPVFKPLNVKGDDEGQYVFRLKANEAADWKACQEAGTLPAYQAFLVKYPKGMYAQAARSTLTELEEEAAWDSAKQANTILSYYDYNRRYPAGRYRAEALEAIERLEEEQAWQEAQRAGTLSAFMKYQERYPQGYFAVEAEAQIQALVAGQREPAAWREAKRKGSAAAYEAYLQQYPQGKHVAEARAAIQELKRKAEEEQARQAEMARQRKQAEAPQQRREEAVARKKEPVTGSPPPKQTPARESQGQNRKKWLLIALGVLAGVLMIWVITKIVNGGSDRLPEEQPQEMAEDTAGQAATPIPLDTDPKEDSAPPSEVKPEPPPPPKLSHGWDLKNDQLKARLSEGTPPYTLQLLRRGKEVYRKEQLPAGSHYITLTKYREDAGSYELRVEDKNGQTASQTITIDPPTPTPKQKAVEPPATAQGTTGTARLGGRTYRTVRLNGKTWMAENLNYDITDSWCYEGTSGNCDQYGRLYTWEAAKKACAAVGWRLPTDEEWKALANSFGGYYDWPTSTDIGDPKRSYNALLKGGSSGFAALLGGYRDTSGNYNLLKVYGYYWSGTAKDTQSAWLYIFNSDYGKLYRNYSDKSFGFSCRCLQD